MNSLNKKELLGLVILAAIVLAYLLIIKIIPNTNLIFELNYEINQHELKLELLCDYLDSSKANNEVKVSLENNNKESSESIIDIKKPLLLLLNETNGEVLYLSIKDLKNNNYDLKLRYIGRGEEISKLLNIFKNLSMKARQEELSINSYVDKSGEMIFEYSAQILKGGYLIEVSEGQEEEYGNWSDMFKKE